MNEKKFQCHKDFGDSSSTSYTIVNLEDALHLIDLYPSYETYKDAFLGFTNENDNVIQFIKNIKNQWILDVPIYENGKYTFSEQEGYLTTEEVKDLIKRFFEGEEIVNKYQDLRMEKIKRILQFENEKKGEITKKEMITIGFGIYEVKDYMTLLNQEISYDKSEIDIFLDEAEEAIRKFENPSLFDLVNGMDLDITTAKKIGKYLMDQNLINSFSRFSEKPFVKSQQVPSKKSEKKLIFISYATKDAQIFQIRKISDALTKYKEIEDVLYWQEDMHDNIFKYMNDNLAKCDVMLLCCSSNALNSLAVEKEWTAAEALNKPIIPIFIKTDHIPPLLRSRLGIEFDTFDFKRNIENIYNLIIKKCENSHTE